jgi:hypothetical protein
VRTSALARPSCSGGEFELIKREWSLLFNDYDLRSVLQAQLNKVAENVRKIPAAEFDSESDEFLSARVASELVVSPVSLLEDDVEVSTKDVQIDVSHDFGRATNPWGPTSVDGLEVTYHLPFTGDRELLRCRPSAFTLNGARAVIGDGELRFPYDSPDREVIQTKQWFTEDLAKLNRWLGWVNAQVSEFNQGLEPNVRAQVASRRTELERTKTDVNSLGYKLRHSGPIRSKGLVSGDEAKKQRAVRREKAHRGYDVALSFAGEDRQYVDAVANALIAKGVTVFYDRFEQVNLWGSELAEHLGRVYGKDAAFTVLFASRHYASKAWPNHEKSYALARHLKGEKGRILPVRFDDTEIPGLPGTIGYLDLRAISPDQLAELIRQKVDLGTDQT